MAGESYKQFIPELELSIERHTNDVPPDGKYYLLYRGQVLEAFRSLTRAQERFRQLISEMGYKPGSSTVSAKPATELDIERYLDAKDLYWAESHRFRGRGGRGGRGGV